MKEDKKVFREDLTTKKIFVALLIILTISPFRSVQLPLAEAEETQTFVGTIESFPYGFRFKSGPPLWPFGMIQVKAGNGGQNNFLIVGSGPRASIFYDIDGKSLGTVTASLSKAEVGKKVEIGKKVEVTYTTPPETARFINRNLAISVRYVPADYVPQAATTIGQTNVTAQAAATANAYGEKIFIGKIESSSSTFHIPSKRKIVVVADNGDKLTVFVSREIAIRDMKAYPTRVGKRAEIKYAPSANGENEAVSFRYLD